MGRRGAPRVESPETAAMTSSGQGGEPHSGALTTGGLRLEATLPPSSGMRHPSPPRGARPSALNERAA